MFSSCVVTKISSDNFEITFTGYSGGGGYGGYQQCYGSAGGGENGENGHDGNPACRDWGYGGAGSGFDITTIRLLNFNVRWVSACSGMESEAFY